MWWMCRACQCVPLVSGLCSCSTDLAGNRHGVQSRLCAQAGSGHVFGVAFDSITCKRCGLTTSPLRALGCTVGITGPTSRAWCEFSEMAFVQGTAQVLVLRSRDSRRWTGVVIFHRFKVDTGPCL